MTCRPIAASTALLNSRFAIHLVLLLSALCAGNIVRAQNSVAVASFIELPWRYVIGGYANGQWLDSEATGKLLTKPTEYRVFALDGVTESVSAAPAAPDADVCPDVAMQTLTPAPQLENIAIGVQATWNPLPRKAQLLAAAEPIHHQAVVELLASHGIAQPTVAITQVLRIDLDGDGTTEELVAATHYVHQDELFAVEEDDYSFVALQRLVNGQKETQVLRGEYYPKKVEDAALNIYAIAGVLDLNGDGVLEVLVNSSYYEGGGLTVWQLQQNTLVEVLAVECGV